MPSSIGQCSANSVFGSAAGDERDDAADEDRDHGVEQRDREAGDEQRGEQPLRLRGEMPIERHQPRRRLGCSGYAVGFSSRSKIANMRKLEKGAARGRRAATRATLDV